MQTDQRVAMMPAGSPAVAADRLRPAYLAPLDSGELDRRVAKAWAHLEDCGEENPLRGWKGSCAIFFSWCRLIDRRVR